MRILVAAVLIIASFAASAPSRAAPDEFAMLTPGPGATADRIVVLKGERQLVLMRGERVLKVYRIALGRYPSGHKTRQGDAKTPEGSYTIDYRLDTGESNFYRALHISYPNARDRARAYRMGVDPGGQIMIHGLPLDWTARQLDHPELDWTQGCIAVTNREIDEIWAMVNDGTRIDIYP